MTTTLEQPTTTTPTPGELVASKTICLVLKVGRFGNSRKASLAPVHVDADKSLLRLNKTLLDSPELTAIQKFDSALNMRIRRVAYTSYFKGGVYLIPLSQVGEIETMLKEAIPVRQTLVDIAVNAYDTRRNETLERLGDVASVGDYPSKERFASTFYVEYSYVTFETPSRLKAISAAIFQQEAQKAQAKLESVAGEVTQAMRVGLLDLIEHLQERLQPGVDGKQKKLHKTAVSHLTEFLQTFELRNVTDDSELGAIVEKARSVMEGVDKDTLKSDDLIRAKVLEQLSDVKAALDPLVEDRATRLISFDDDDAE